MCFRLNTTSALGSLLGCRIEEKLGIVAGSRLGYSEVVDFLSASRRRGRGLLVEEVL